jgi:lipid II:glycine glycyltransferase (peptidoglycan interpeptide bridge formation enzyme)
MIEFVSLEHSQELDQYVSNHKNGHFMQTSLWGRARSDRNWIGIIDRDENGSIRGTMSLLCRPMRKINQQLLYAPRGPVFNDINSFLRLVDAAVDYGKKHHGYMLRIDPPVLADNTEFASTAVKKGFSICTEADFGTYQPKNVYQTDLTGMTEETLLESFHQKTRYNIRLALRKGVTVREGSVADVPVFQDMLKDTGKRDGFTVHSQSFYTEFLEAMPGNAHLFLAEVDGKVAAGTMEVIQGDKAWYVYGGSYIEHRNLMPNYLLQWEMMRAGLRNGCTLYDFRGVEGFPTEDNPKYGLHRFKQGFNSRFVEYIGQMDLIISKFSYNLVRVVERLSKLH